MSTPATAPGARTGAGLLVKSLEAQGVEYVFGVPGAKIDKVFDILLDSRIKTVVCWHEQNAAFTAAGIGRVYAFAAADSWRGVYLVTVAVLVVFRLAVPVAQALRHRLRVADVVAEGPGVVSVHIVGRRLDRLGAEPGQFFLWRFLDRRRQARA